MKETSNSNALRGTESFKERTIAECAVEAIRVLGKPSTVAEIYDFIIKTDSYTFNTPVPQHVLRTTIRRHTLGASRVDMAEAQLFEETEGEVYRLVTTVTKKRSQPGMRRIHRASDKEELIKSLTHESTGVFREIWRLLLFAAVLGFDSKRRTPLASVDAGRGIDQSTFGNSPSWPGILHLMGLVETNSTQLFASSDDSEMSRIQMFEEYANGGLEILSEIAAGREANFDFLVNFVTERLHEPTATAPDLKIEI